MSSSSAILLGIMGFSGGELLIVLAIILLLFGGSKLPSLAKGLGQSIKEFKKAAKDDEPEAPAKAEAKKPDSGGAPGAN
jgi:sec-independent protein translocase protein TatA